MEETVKRITKELLAKKRKNNTNDGWRERMEKKLEERKQLANNTTGIYI